MPPHKKILGVIIPSGNGTVQSGAYCTILCFQVTGLNIGVGGGDKNQGEGAQGSRTLSSS